jgi:hypothetical protein
MLPPWLRQTYVALMLSAERKATIGPLPSPAAFPLQVRTPLFDLLQVGVPMKCALSAKATVESAAIAPASTATTT